MIARIRSGESSGQFATIAVSATAPVTVMTFAPALNERSESKGPALSERSESKGPRPAGRPTKSARPGPRRAGAKRKNPAGDKT